MALPLDVTGASPANLIPAELHTVTEPAIFTVEGPFYGSMDFQVHGHWASDNSSHTLSENIDYVFGPLFTVASGDIGKEIYSFIILIDYAKWSNVTLHYQGVGYDPDQVLLDEIIAAGNFDRTNVNNWLSFQGDVVSINTIGADHNLKNTSVAFLFAGKLNRIALALQTPSSYITFIMGAFTTLQNQVNAMVSQVNAIEAGSGNGDPVTATDMDSAIDAAVSALTALNTATNDTLDALSLDVIHKLTASRTIYVNATPSGAQDGLTPATGFDTITKAWRYANSILDNGYNFTIQIEDGTYTGSNLVNSVNDTINIRGNLTTPGNVVITSTLQISNSVINLSGLTLTNANPNGNCLLIKNGAQVSFGTGMVIGTNDSASSAQISVQLNAVLNIANDYEVTGGGTRHLGIHTGAQVTINGSVITFTGTVDYTDEFVWVQNARLSSVGCTFTGTVTGKRFTATNLAILDLGAGGATYLPGDVAGTVDAGTYSILV